MELLRKKTGNISLNNLPSSYYGNLEELKVNLPMIKYPIVVKSSGGSMSKGVFLANNQSELLKYVKRISRTRNYIYEIKDH